MVSTINKNLVAPPRLHELAFSTLLKTKPEKKKKKKKKKDEVWLKSMECNLGYLSLTCISRYRDGDIQIEAEQNFQYNGSEVFLTTGKTWILQETITGQLMAKLSSANVFPYFKRHEKNCFHI